MTNIKKVSIFFILAFLFLTFPLKSYAIAKWTIMIYLDGDNDLEKYAINDFLEVASIGSTQEINFIVQLDRIPGYDTRYGNWTNTQRFRITQNMEPTISNAISDWGDGFGGREVNMGDPLVLRSFILWAKQNYPAQYYALILWDHGDGWRSMDYVANEIEQQLKRSNLSREVRTSLEKTLKELKRKIYARRYQKSVCFDNTSFDELSLKEIRQALSGPDCYVDIIAFDACLMGMIEVAYEVRNCATYMIASEETIFTSGFPYNTIAQDIINNPDYQPDQFSERIVQHYSDFYGHYGTETLSAVNLAFCDQIFDAINDFCQVAMELDNQWLYFHISLSQTPVFDDPDYRDLKTFIEGVFNNASKEEMVNASEIISSIFDSMIVANFGKPKGTGLSIYFPGKNTGVDPAYNQNNLEFAQGLWKNFLQSFYSADVSRGFTILLRENFDSGLPPGWTIIDGNNDRKTWTTSNPKNRDISELTSPFIIADSDWAGRVWMNEQLITKNVTVNGYSKIFLKFDHFFNVYGSEIADVDIKVDDGNWQNIKRFRYQDARGTVILSLQPYLIKAGETQIQIRWNYQNAYDALYWAIDNVYLLMEGTAKGDINKDGLIDISDVILCLRISIDLAITINGQIYENPYTP
ncbi:MAG: clostripain-related cysteine peptidase, partial [Candidatus Omnitrophica bacterium]|nr:clostripain-related cysteine peptidase [Candidatus Omnitrophota bacterium]